MITMEIEELRQWAENNNVYNDIIDSFEGLLKNYELEDSEEYNELMNEIDKNCFEYDVHTVSFNLGNWPECSRITISISISISISMKVFYKRRHFADYRIYYLPSGEVEDDFVEFI